VDQTRIEWQRGGGFKRDAVIEPDYLSDMSVKATMPYLTKRGDDDIESCPGYTPQLLQKWYSCFDEQW
jgi:hypothetical protein